MKVADLNNVIAFRREGKTSFAEEIKCLLIEGIEYTLRQQVYEYADSRYDEFRWYLVDENDNRATIERNGYNMPIWYTRKQVNELKIDNVLYDENSGDWIILVNQESFRTLCERKPYGAESYVDWSW